MMVGWLHLKQKLATGEDKYVMSLAQLDGSCKLADF
jgi:hypothetical protein